MTDVRARSRHDGARLLFAALASVSGLALSAPAFAQSADGTPGAIEAQRDFDIPAQPLSSALVRFAEQSGLQILFSQDEVEGLTSRTLAGRFTPENALARLLPADAPHIGVSEDGTVRVRQPAQRSGANVDADEDASMGDENLVVTGTRIRGAAPAGANVTTLDREAIAETGRSTVQDVLATLPQNFFGGQNEAAQQSSASNGRNLSFGASVNLRGLGADSTLTLVNGRRLAPAGFGHFVDVSSIPLAAVRSVDILADGASATYGSDAVGGVVNIILQDDYAGAETMLRGGGDGRGDVTDLGLSQLAGWNWAGGNLVVAYEYRDRSDLDWNDREFTSNSDLSRYGGRNYSRTQANPGTITRLGATAVTYAIPTGQNGTSLAQAQLIAGQTNRQNAVEGMDVLPEQRSHALFAAARQDLGPRLEIFAELMASYRNSLSQRTQQSANIVIPVSNYYRQLNNLFLAQGPMTIAYFFGDDLGPIETDAETQTLLGTLGADYDLGGDWSAEFFASYGRNTEDVLSSNLYDATSPLVTAAYASGSAATAFNPFADGSNTPQSVLDVFTYSTHLRSESEITTFALKVDGPLFDLWGGPLRAALGIERREESFAIDRIEYRATGPRSQGFQRPGERTIDALFAELNAPLIGPGNNVPLVHGLVLSLSARREEANDYGAATVPRVGVNWEVTDTLRVRAAWGRSFKGPTFDQTQGAQALAYQVLTPALDPLADDGSTNAMLVSGGNEDLRPEEAETWSAGFDYRADIFGGFSLSASYFDITFEDRISDGGVSAAVMLQNPTGYESFLIRDPSQAVIDYYLALPALVAGQPPASGVELIIDTRLRNVAQWTIRGIDLSADLRFETSIGEIGVFGSATNFLEHSRQILPGSASVSSLDTVFNPLDWRIRSGVSWRNEDWAASLSANYQNEYSDTNVTPAAPIDAYTTWDLRAARTFRRSDTSALQVSLSVQNLFDEDPPFTNNAVGMGFDPGNASPIGRFAVVEVRQTW